MLLIPVATGTLLVVSPGDLRLIPFAFWAAWLLISFVVSLEAPSLADWLAPPSHSPYGMMRYARRVLVLGLMNLVSSAVALFIATLGKPPG